MELAQSILAVLFYIVWYGFFTILIFDFLIGLPALMHRVETELKQAQAEKTVTLSAQARQAKQPLQVVQSTPLTKSQPAAETTDKDAELFADEQGLVPRTKADEATLQYLEITGCDINDFQSISQARRFLDKHAPWSMETETPPIQAAEQQTALPVPDPWLEPIADLSLVVEAEAEAELKPSSATQKLTFNQVCIEFANQGLALERYRSGHHCYRVVFGCNSSTPCRFKTLQEALDWLTAGGTSFIPNQNNSKATAPSPKFAVAVPLA
jgi:hypothetical protein